MRRIGWIVSGLFFCFFVGCSGPSEPRMYVDAGPIPDVFVPEPDGYVPPVTEQFPIPIDLRCATTLDPSQWVRQVAHGPDGSFYVRGTFTGDADLDPGPGTEPYVAPASDSAQGFVAAFDADCSYRWTRVFDGAITLHGMGVDAAGHVVVDGAVGMDPFGDPISVDFDPTAGNDRRPTKNVIFVTRFAPDGSYLSTATRAWCSPETAMLGGTCDRPPLLLPNGTAVAADGTTYVSTDRELVRAAPEGSFGWPSLPPDGGVPAPGAVELGPGGEIWVARAPSAYPRDWSGGIDEPTPNCRPGVTPCAERAAISRIEPDGTYAGSVVQPPNQAYGVMDFAVDGAGDLQLVGRYESGTSGVLAPNFDWSGGVERWGGTGFWGSAMGPDATLRFSTVYGVGQTTTATFGVPYGGAISVDRSAGIVYRSGNFTASVGTRTGVFFTDDNRYDAFVSAESADGRPLWSAGIGAPGSPPGPQILVEAGSDGRFALAFAGPDLDITSGTLAPPHAGTSIVIYEPETCTDGETRPTVCTGADPATLTCAGGRWGPSTCDETSFDRARVCMVTCEQLSSRAVACGSHDDGCGGTLSCGTCAEPMVCGGTERTCRGPSGSTAIATGLNHPDHRIALDATHVYFAVQGDFAMPGPPGDATVMRVPRDASAPATVVATAGRNLEFAVGSTHVYVIDPDAGTFSRAPKDGSGALETIATGLRNARGIVADGDMYVYYTTELESEPLHPRWLYSYDQQTTVLARVEGLSFRPSGLRADETNIYVSAVPAPPDTVWYTWARGEVGLPRPELLVGTRLSIVAIDPAAGVVYGTMPFEQALYRQAFGSGGGAHVLVTRYSDPLQMPAPGGVRVGAGLWWVEEGEWARRTWTGRVRRADLTTGESQIAYAGLNHAAAIAGDAAGLFVATRGDLAAHGTTGEIVRIW